MVGGGDITDYMGYIQAEWLDNRWMGGQIDDRQTEQHHVRSIRKECTG